uniref:NADH dehydrogenase [ubiquinone] 1 alpha subcomplex subunit 11 n=1 Tax=Kryptolebias marmoratus TaxID=37003 RepID=A0A3Q3A008_KRYMA
MSFTVLRRSFSLARGLYICAQQSFGHLLEKCSEKHIFHLLPANKCVLPPASLGAVFGMTTCVSAEVRDAPDDPLNFFIGGCTSGVLLGAKTHSAMTGTSACLGLGTLAFFIKVGKMEGWKLSGPPKL